MHALVTRVRALSPRAIVLSAWVGLLIYAYPGYLSHDSVEQLVQARSGALTDAYPPLMTMVWRIVDAVIPGPFGMLVIQSASFVVGAYLTLSSTLSPRRAALGALAVAWFPPVAATLAVIWAHSFACGLWLFAIGLLLRGGPRARIVALVIAGVASTLHPGGMAAALPIVVALWATRQGWQRYAVAVALWLAITLVPRAVATAISTDVAAVSREATFREVLYLDNAPPGSAYIWFTDVQDPEGSAGRIGHGSRPSGAQSVLHPVMTWLGSTWLFAPYVYALLALVLVPLCLRHERARVLLASGIASTVAVFFIGAEAHLRTSIWLVVTTLLAATLAIARYCAGRPAPRNSVPADRPAPSTERSSTART